MSSLLFSLVCTDYLPEEHPDVVNTEGIHAHDASQHATNVDSSYFIIAALAAISETALHMNSTIVDLVTPITMLCIHTKDHDSCMTVCIRKGRRWC